jgi:hypothetical protein
MFTNELDVCAIVIVVPKNVVERHANRTLKRIEETEDVGSFPGVTRHQDQIG